MVTELLRPAGVGSETAIDTQFPDSGEHWEKVCEASPDDDTSYVENKNGPVGVYQRDLYSLPPRQAADSGTINKITVYFRVLTNAVSIKASIRTHSTPYDGTGHGAATWTTYSQEWANNPFTGEAWTWDEIDALELGVAIAGNTNTPDWARCTQVYVVIDYTCHPPIEEQVRWNSGMALRTEEDRRRLGQELIALDRTITKLAFLMNREAEPLTLPPIYYEIRKGSPDWGLIYSQETDLITQLTGAPPQWYEVALDTPQYVNEKIWIGVRWDGGGTSKGVNLKRQDTDVKAGEYLWMQDWTDVWLSMAANDLAYKYTYFPGKLPGGGSLGKHKGFNLKGAGFRP